MLHVAVDGRALPTGSQSNAPTEWKYINYTELDGMDELYDLRVDPQEMRNLINDPASQSSLQRLKAKLRRLNHETR